jgi:TolA-binding protein
MGNLDKAKKVLKAYLQKFPKGNFAISVKELLATIYEEEGDIKDAIKYYESLPKTDNTTFKLATLLFKIGDYEKAKQYFLELYNKYPDMKNDLAYYLGKIEYKLGNLKTAIKYLNEATQGGDYKHVAESYFLLAEIYKKTGAKDKALNNYLNVIYLYPEAKKLVEKSRIEASDLLKEEGKEMEASCIIKPLLKAEDETIFNIAVQKLKELQRCNK